MAALAILPLAVIPTAVFAQPAGASAPLPPQVVSPDRVMVKVNGQTITGRQYFLRMQVLQDVGKLVGEQFVPASPGFMTLQQLINESLIIQLARQQGVYPSDAELDAEIAKRLKENSKLKEAFTMLGLTDEDFKWDVLVTMCQFRVITKGVNITDFEVENSYKANVGTRYTLPKRFVVRVITVGKAEDQKKVDDALLAGKTWGQVASEFSQDSGKLDEGRFGTFPDSELKGTLRAEIDKIKKGDQTKWISAGSMFAKFWLEDVMEKEVIPLDDKLKGQIRQNLLLERGQAKNNISKLLDEMRKGAKIEFTGTPFDESLRKVFLGGS
jgi:parvulin-like peptidyl-prolyl isomerase